jgi:hypothetical protein
MKHVRKPMEGDAQWLKRHNEANGLLEGTETEQEYKARITWPDPALNQTVDDWLADARYEGLAVQDPRPGESWEDWRARVNQKHPSEAVAAKNLRTTNWNKAHPKADGVPRAGAGAGAGGGGPAGLQAPAEDLPQFSTNAVFATAKVADTAQCQRIRIAYHLFVIPNVDHAVVIKNVRRRTYKWVRRVFAQARLSPKIVEINTIGPLAAPVPNMISIYNYVGLVAGEANRDVNDAPILPNLRGPLPLCSGRASDGRPSTVTIVIEDILPAGRPDCPITATIWPNDPPPPNGVTPLQMGQAIVNAINDPGNGFGFAAVLEVVPKSDQPICQGCDIFVTKQGKARRIKRLTDNDVGLNRPPPADDRVDGKSAVEKQLIQVPGLARAANVLELPAAGVEFKLGGDDDLIGGEPTQRRVLRMGRPGEDLDQTERLASEPQDNRIDIYVVPTMTLAGRAYPDYAVTASDPASAANDINDPDFNVPTPLKNAAILAYVTNVERLGAFRPMDGTDASPFTLPHEIGHVLGRLGHNEAQGDLMAGRWPKKPEDSGMNPGAIDNNGVHAAKRIYGAPLIVGTKALRNNQVGGDNLLHNDRDMGNEMRQRAPHLLEPW